MPKAVIRPDPNTLLAVDCETTGMDFRHGSTPFCVTTCDQDGRLRYWEWDVDPATRQVQKPSTDISVIGGLLAGAQRLVGHNIKFDAHALGTTKIHWDGLWGKTDDTLLYSHILGSNEPHDLTSLALNWLGEDIKPLENRLKGAVQECRRIVRTRYPDWRTAKKDDPDMPSAGDSSWGADYWLPKCCFLRFSKQDMKPEWDTVLIQYALKDAEITIRLYAVFQEEIRRRGLEEIYEEKRQSLKALWRMEQRGATLLPGNLASIQKDYASELEELSEKCKSIAQLHGYNLTLPKGSSNNKSLLTCVFDVLNIPVRKSTDTGQPSLTKDIIDDYKKTLDGEQREFIVSLGGIRKRNKALESLLSYQKFGVPYLSDDKKLEMCFRPESRTFDEFESIRVIHPSFNPTGTATTRLSCSLPNLQQVSKQESNCEECGGEGCENCHGSGRDLQSIRQVFGPAPGREWWTADAENIELRIPAYVSGQEELIALFERPKDPPFYGSQHLLNFSVVYPDLWAEMVNKHGQEGAGKAIKREWASTWYQWCKNGDFAIQYQCGEATADRSFRRSGSYRRLKSAFARLEDLNQKCVAQANKRGYVETLPYKGQQVGYPLLCQRGEYGRVIPTTPLNYMVQGTAGRWMTAAIVRCDKVLEEWRSDKVQPFDSWILLTVHDELVFDFPKRGNPIDELNRIKDSRSGTTFKSSNLARALRIKKLMEQGGVDIGVPTPVALKYCPNSWADGISVS